MIGFGHNGATIVQPRFGVQGVGGVYHELRTVGEALLVATYCDPCESLVYEVVPIPSWPNRAANDWHYEQGD